MALKLARKRLDTAPTTKRPRNTLGPRPLSCTSIPFLAALLFTGLYRRSLHSLVKRRWWDGIWPEQFDQWDGRCRPSLRDRVMVIATPLPRAFRCDVLDNAND